MSEHRMDQQGRHKKCCMCQRILPAGSFYPQRDRVNGLSGRCRNCSAAKQQTKSYKEQHARSQRRWAARNPEKTKAHDIVHAQGVPLADRCARCGSGNNLHRHHPDYTKPKEVITLCSACHRKTHCEESTT